VHNTGSDRPHQRRQPVCESIAIGDSVKSIIWENSGSAEGIGAWRALGNPPHAQPLRSATSNRHASRNV